MFKDAGFKDRMMSVPEEEDGVDLQWLKNQLAKSDEGHNQANPSRRRPDYGRKFYHHIIYAVPTCANPSGRTMSLSTRKNLITLARKHDALIICDDVYDLLQWPLLHDTLPPASLPPTSQNPNYTAYPPGSTVSGGVPSQFTSAIVTQLLTSGKLDEHINTCVRPGLQRRQAVLERAARVPGSAWRVVGANGGVFGGCFLWLTLPYGGLWAAEFAKRAETEEGVLIAPGDLFAVPGRGVEGRYVRNVRPCFALEDEERIEEAVRGLARVLRMSSRFDVKRS
ncbi:hypothetical protein ACHAQH_008786 [Verticillium albo-atrum]